MAALAISLGYLEVLIPFSVGIYGIKLGIANLAILSLLYLADTKSALAVHLLRIVVCGMLFGNAIALIYSAVGGILSFVVMALLKKSEKLSPIGISICGGVVHNIAQLGVAVILLDELKIAFYLPVLLIAGTVAGAIVGLLSQEIVKKFR
ncbi:MAG: Gx transporter family protein [Clostridia bacterium]|nr:Gx transporter family protein [Clostridia bacterium]